MSTSTNRGSGSVIYLDNHSASKPCSSAIERMQPYLNDLWGPGFAPYQIGRELSTLLDVRYRALYDLVGADSEDTCIITSSGAEALNQALWSVFLQKAKKEGKCHFVVSCLEDAPTMQMMQRLEEFGCYVKIAPVTSAGEIDLEQLKSLIGPRTAAVSVTMADGLTGVLQPISEIAALCKKQGTLLHVDASYAIGKLYLSFRDLGAAYLSFSGDRLHALKSSGALFVKAKTPLSPLILGGTEQAGLRGGAFDTPSVMALSAAASQAEIFIDQVALETARLRDLLESKLIQKVPGVKALFSDHLRLPNVAVVAFPGVHAEALLYLLSKKGICASAGGLF
ncbi:MAG: aminotransferase class V-fold PLP-dependent enzyme, partial [Chlamydiae bacterium]|nr:aminotransferase class V-fold PLP-dependent enzyme [Chlamydiota bacterium]